MIFLQRVDYRIIPVSLYYQYLGRRKVTCIVLLVTLCWSIQVLGFHQSWSQSIPMTSEESSDPRMDANHALFVQSQRGILVFWGNIYTSGSPFYMPGEKECENCQKKNQLCKRGSSSRCMCVFLYTDVLLGSTFLQPPESCLRNSVSYFIPFYFSPCAWRWNLRKVEDEEMSEEWQACWGWKKNNTGRKGRRKVKEAEADGRNGSELRWLNEILRRAHRPGSNSVLGNFS